MQTLLPFLPRFSCLEQRLAFWIRFCLPPLGHSAAVLPGWFPAFLPGAPFWISAVLPACVFLLAACLPAVLLGGTYAPPPSLRRACRLLLPGSAPARFLRLPAVLPACWFHAAALPAWFHLVSQKILWFHVCCGFCGCKLCWFPACAFCRAVAADQVLGYRHLVFWISRFCTKQDSGFCLRLHRYRFTAVWFCVLVSGAPLVAACCLRVSAAVFSACGSAAALLCCRYLRLPPAAAVLPPFWMRFSAAAAVLGFVFMHVLHRFRSVLELNIPPASVPFTVLPFYWVVSATVLPADLTTCLPLLPAAVPGSCLPGTCLLATVTHHYRNTACLCGFHLHVSACRFLDT